MAFTLYTKTTDKEDKIFLYITTIVQVNPKTLLSYGAEQTKKSTYNYKEELLEVPKQ